MALKQTEAGYSVCPGCGGFYMVESMHVNAPRHREWLKDQRIGQMEVPVPEQPMPRAFDRTPDRIVFGETVRCPRCKGRKATHKMVMGRKVKLRPDEQYAKDPDKPSRPCPRCRGVGLVPNVSV